MADFESWQQYQEFAQYIMKTARHVFDARNRQFIESVVETSGKRRVIIPVGSVLWRAQLGSDTRIEAVNVGDDVDPEFVDIECPYQPERMNPLIDRASEGRVNPKGIPCLYCSTDRETAMTETRPWIGSCGSVAQFVILKDLTFVDCSADWEMGSMVYLGPTEPTPFKREAYVWRDINRAF